jgi:hypothetical protein
MAHLEALLGGCIAACRRQAGRFSPMRFASARDQNDHTLTVEIANVQVLMLAPHWDRCRVIPTMPPASRWFLRSPTTLDASGLRVLFCVCQ